MTGNTVEITEKQFQKQIIDLAHLFKWTLYHTEYSRWSNRGFPDLVMVRPPRVIFAELKSNKGQLTEFQKEWITILHQCPTVEVYLWRPAFWDSIVEVLQRE